MGKIRSKDPATTTQPNMTTRGIRFSKKSLRLPYLSARKLRGIVMTKSTRVNQERVRKLQRKLTSEDPYCLHDPLHPRQVSLDSIDLAQLLLHAAVEPDLGRVVLTVVLATESSLDDTIHRKLVEAAREVDQQHQSQQRSHRPCSSLVRLRSGQNAAIRRGTPCQLGTINIHRATSAWRDSAHEMSGEPRSALTLPVTISWDVVRRLKM